MIDIYLINALLLLIMCLIINYTPKSVVMFKTEAMEYQINIKKIVFLLVWFIILSVEFGFRGNFTTDYTQYKYWFNFLRKFSFSDIIHVNNFEKGYLFLNYLVGQISDEYSTFTIITGFFSVGLFIYAIGDLAEEAWISVLAFVGSGLFYGGFNLSSQFISASVYTLAIKKIKDGKFIQYCIVVFVASMIHKSALFMLPIYFLLRMKLNKRNGRIAILLCGMISVMLMFFINPMARLLSSVLYESTYINFNPVQGITWGYIIKNITLLAIILLYVNLFDIENMFDRIVIIGSVAYTIVIVWSIQYSLIQRFAYYLIMFPVIALSMIIHRSKNKQTIAFVLIAYFFVMQMGRFGAEYFFFFTNK